MSTPSDSAVSPMSGTAAAPRSAFAPLRDRTFALYLSGQLLSQIGDGVYLVALPFLVLGRGGGVASSVWCSRCTASLGWECSRSAERWPTGGAPGGSC